MTPTPAPAPRPDVDWAAVRLVVFDMDGTLYDQPPLRRRMASTLLAHAALRRDLRLLRVIRALRAEREALAEAEVHGFEATLTRRVADRFGLPAERVDAIAAEWLSLRPLRHLPRCRAPGVAALFHAIRAGGRSIAVLSDYPVRDKLAALGLEADLALYAGDAEIGVQKPHPAGLLAVCAALKAEPAETLMIGDRDDRDGAAARRAGAAALIRGRDFQRFDAPVFGPLLSDARRRAA